jgi:hypothetical protein
MDLVHRVQNNMVGTGYVSFIYLAPPNSDYLWFRVVRCCGNNFLVVLWPISIPYWHSCVLQTFPHLPVRYKHNTLLCDTDSDGVEQEQACVLVHASASVICRWSWTRVRAFLLSDPTFPHVHS